jgi:class 3 adenylate cyclase
MSHTPLESVAEHTVVFTDLYGSTRLFESLGNQEATRLVTRITSWIAGVFHAHQGRVVKKLGDGVLCLFDDQPSALAAVLAVQRGHQAHLFQLPLVQQLPIRAGLARGPVELVAHDCYGDTVNVAARLSQLCGPHQILAHASALQGLPQAVETPFKPLGYLNLRGRVAACQVFQVEWLVASSDPDQAVFTRFMTGGVADTTETTDTTETAATQLVLTWNQMSRTFKPEEKAVQLGRHALLDVVLSSPVVSRNHARLAWRNGCVMLADVSSNGTWVRFDGARTDVHLRREECVLHGKGQLALGASFTDPHTTLVSFSLGA